MWCTRLEVEAFDDPTVLAESRKYHWVCVDRDVTPEVPKRLNVSAYPSLLVLGANEENVHRFSGFAKKAEFAGRLREGLTRWDLFRKGKTWDTPTPRPDALTTERSVTSIPAPSGDVPNGIAVLGDDLLVAQGGALRRLDPATGDVRGEHAIDSSIVDIAVDGGLVYAVPSGWTAGRPILVIDPETWKTNREIVTEKNRENRAHGAKGITVHGGRLLVLEGMHGRIHEVDRESGDVVATIQTAERWLSGLASDGAHLLVGSRDTLFRLDATTGATVGQVAVNYPLRSVGVQAGNILVMEQPVFGHGRRHERIQVWPTAGTTRVHVLRPAAETPSSDDR